VRSAAAIAFDAAVFAIAVDAFARLSAEARHQSGFSCGCFGGGGREQHWKQPLQSLQSYV